MRFSCERYNISRPCQAAVRVGSFVLAQKRLKLRDKKLHKKQQMASSEENRQVLLLKSNNTISTSPLSFPFSFFSIIFFFAIVSCCYN